MLLLDQKNGMIRDTISNYSTGLESYYSSINIKGKKTVNFISPGKAYNYNINYTPTVGT